MTLRKIFALTFLMATAFLLPAQTYLSPIIDFNEKNSGIGGKTSHNADKLVAALIKDKTTDKEKFDAIFAWVARNIRYSYNSRNDVDWILKHRRTICLGYSGLMDTLCRKAGITSAMVFGYAKDEIFDVGDSLYVDNHAWNAVKLEGEWYVYDVTWSAGRTHSELRRLSKFKKKLQDGFKPKYKNKKLGNGKAGKDKSFCPSPDVSFYLKQRFFNRLWQRFIFSLTLRGKIIYRRNLTTDFYLTQPEVFAITHHADDKSWNLVPGRTLTDFEVDSAFYYLDTTVYVNQQRRGSTCSSCDDWIEKEERDRLAHLRDTSEKNNPRNHFITGMCWREMAQLMVKEQENEVDDSLQLKKIILAEKEFNTSTRQYNKTLPENSKETGFHYKKNRSKVNSSALENRAHYKKAEKERAKCYYQMRLFKRVHSKNKGGISASFKKKKRIRSITCGAPKPGSNAEENILRLNKMLVQEEKITDSVDVMIEALKIKYDSLLAHLSLNAGQLGRPLDSLQRFLLKRLALRGRMYDGFKKPIIDLKKRIDSLEADHLLQMKTLIHDPADTAYAIFESIYKLTGTRQKSQEKCVKLLRDLVKNGDQSIDALTTYKININEKINRDICWFENTGYSSRLMYRGLRFTAMKEKQVQLILNEENYTERLRGHYMDLFLNARYLRHSRIAKNNLREIRFHLKKLKKPKREVQKRIKDKLRGK